MTETGFKYFLLALQEKKDSEAAKRKRREDRLAKHEAQNLRSKDPLISVGLLFPIRPACISFLRVISLPDEDYTGAVCLLHTLTKLFPAYQELLVDSDDMDRLSAKKWHLARCSRERTLRVMNSQGKYLHVFVMNPPAGMVVDHKFHQTLDNRKSQLRICTTRENNINRQPRANKASKYKGVARSKRTEKWFVHAGPRSGRFFIGGFDSEVDAAVAYNELARRLYGSMAYQNRVG